jgi:Tfp pilus assembly protein PilV
MPSWLKSVTFIELLIAIILLAVVILAINNIDVFSRYHIVSSDQRVKVQNDIARCLEHITKNAVNTIGNEETYGTNTTVYVNPDSNNTTTLSFFTDTNKNGTRDSGEGAGDYWVRYNYNTTDHSFSYCSQCPDAACAACSGSEEILAKDITEFSVHKNLTEGNHINVTIAACWDPTKACDISNPGFNMTTAITLPSVSTN